MWFAFVTVKQLQCSKIQGVAWDHTQVVQQAVWGHGALSFSLTLKATLWPYQIGPSYHKPTQNQRKNVMEFLISEAVGQEGKE